VRFLVQVLILFTLAVLALRRRETVEIFGVAIMVAMFAASPVYASLASGPHPLDSIDPGAFLIDVVTLILMLALALKSERWWTLWLAGAQLIAVLSHLVRLMDGEYAPLAYALMMRAPSWIQLLILAFAIIPIRSRENRN
jgi:hypothetical protein